MKRSYRWGVILLSVGIFLSLIIFFFFWHLFLGEREPSEEDSPFEELVRECFLKNDTDDVCLSTFREQSTEHFCLEVRLPLRDYCYYYLAYARQQNTFCKLIVNGSLEGNCEYAIRETAPGTQLVPLS